MDWRLFYNPVELSYNSLLVLLLPLCLSVAIIYKTIRTNDIRKLPQQVAALMLYIIAGLATLGIVCVALLWLHQSLGAH